MNQTLSPPSPMILVMQRLTLQECARVNLSLKRLTMLQFGNISMMHLADSFLSMTMDTVQQKTLIATAELPTPSILVVIKHPMFTAQPDT